MESPWEEYLVIVIAIIIAVVRVLVVTATVTIAGIKAGKVIAAIGRNGVMRLYH